MGEKHSRRGISKEHLAYLGLTILASAVGYTRPTAAANTPLVVDGVDCSRLAELDIDKQVNMRAMMIRIECGLEEAPAEWREREGGQEQLGPIANGPGGPANVNTITDETSAFIQSESMVWSNGETIVVLYNDFQPPAFSGISVSTDSGASFTRLRPSPFSTGHGSNSGDPVVVYNAALGSWFAGYLVGGCGGGVGLWSSADGLNWSSGACATPGGADRESMWVDNNADSPYYGRMYISWNGSGLRLMAVYSDDGSTWSAPQMLTTNFIRNMQVTGSPTDGTVFIVGLDEGGGGLNNRTNLLYRSIDGGASWTTTVMGPPFAPPGDGVCGYFAKINPIWRHMGWGQPGVGPFGVVHYAYAGRGINPGDTGDIFYTVSFDNGDTWSDPIVLNNDAAKGGTGTQWMPSLSVGLDGQVHVSWYDRRNSTDGMNYEFWGVRSPDNGLTWLPDERVSDVLIEQPQEGGCYAGDYNYHTAFGNEHYLTWTDGRNLLGGHFQQDVYFAKLP
jgi:hypothetical protein